MFEGKFFQTRRIFNALLVFSLLFAVAGVGTAAAQEPVNDYEFTTPLFGISAGPGSTLLVADSGAGVVFLNKGTGKLVQPLPGVSDVDSVGRGVALAITGAGDPADPSAGWRFYRVTPSTVEEVANLYDFESTVNPDGGLIDSNPFDVEVLDDDEALVADAGGNSLLIVNHEGDVDWVATLPSELVSTAHAKTLFGCPDVPPELAEVCALPDMIPAEAVATSVAVGPDGAYYVGELKGFPGPVGESRVWRIEPGTMHARCGTDPGCSVVADGFTSIVDLSFGPDGTLYVVEYDENSFLSVELGAMGLPPALAGGTVNACDSTTWNCTEFATDLNLPIAVTVDAKGQVYAVINNMLPEATVVTLP